MFFLPLLTAVLRTAVLPDTLPPVLIQVEDSIHAGRIEAAIALAKDYTGDHRNDPRGFIALGDAYTARMPSGRFMAWKAYRHAEQLAPDDPTPPYKMGATGFILGGADGERLARNGYERVLELDPHYSDAWTRWLVLYRNDGGRRAMIARLRKHPDPEVDSWIARLQIELNDYAAADSNLDSLIARDPQDGSLYALRAQSALEAGDSVMGVRYYQMALRNADNDPEGILWEQAIGIATPEEIRAWEAGIPKDQRGGWFAAFWARRNPDLFSGVNHRLLEHFERLRVARAKYPLQHPLILYNRSKEARGLTLTPSGNERREYLRCEALSDGGAMKREDQATISVSAESAFTAPEPAFPTRRAERVNGNDPDPTHMVFLQSGQDAFGMPYNTLNAETNLIIANVPGINLANVDTTAARVGYNLRTGLSDQGIMYLRFGPPDKLMFGTDNHLHPECAHVMDDVQRWHYPGLGWVRFATPAAFDVGQAIGSPIFRPMNEQQFKLTKLGLTRDASSVPVSLSFGVWTAEFRNRTVPSRTDLAVITTVGEAAAELVDLSSGPRGSVIARSGHVTLQDAPGPYQLVVDAREGEKLGHTTLNLRLERFGPGPAVSDLLVGRAGADTATTREEVFAHVPRDLTFSATDTLRTYAEVYGLMPEAGRVRYDVRYALLKTGDAAADAQKGRWPNATTFTFMRDRPVDANGIAHEFLDLDPKLVSSGVYLLRVRVMDPATGKTVGSAMSEFRMR